MAHPHGTARRGYGLIVVLYGYCFVSFNNNYGTIYRSLILLNCVLLPFIINPQLLLQMRFFLLVILFSLAVSSGAFAQSTPELWVKEKDGVWNIMHQVQKGETVFMLARRYHVPPAILADANGLSYQDQLKELSTVAIPLGAYNLQTQKPVNPAEARSLYYKVTADDNLYSISRHAGVPQRALVQWNNLSGNEATPGKKLLVGWVLYDATQIGMSVTANPSPTIKSTTQVVAPSVPSTTAVEIPRLATTTVGMPDSPADAPAQPVVTLKDLFEEQTMQGQNLVWEKGTAGFFSVNATAKGASVYAFHNKAARGSIIRVKNMNNGKIVFVKVLGPMPNTKQYYNCVIGLSGSAKAALGARDDKAFCELSYAGY